MRRLVIATVLGLISTAALADMYQDAKNAKLPEARDNLELGTVKSIGGDPPDAITRFYTWDKLHPQFQINSQPEGNEWTVEQAGQTGHGSTRLCWSNTSTNVDCNYVAFGLGNHVFGNGAGTQLILDHTGAGPPSGYFRMYSGDDETARLYAESPLVGDVGMYLRAQGAGTITLANSQGNLAGFFNQGSPQYYFAFTAGTTDTPATIASNGAAVQINGQRPPMSTKTANYTLTAAESGTHFDNIGATGAVIFTLPAANRNNNFCFTVDAAQQLRVQTSGGDKIAIAGTNSSVGNYVWSSAPFAALCVKAIRTGQWVTTSTPDKAQWTVN